MTVENYQVEAGILMGPGTDYIIQELTGYGAPAYRTSDDPAPQDHGTWTGPEYLNGRELGLDVVVRGDSEIEAVTNAEALIAAWYIDTRDDGYGASTTFTTKLPGWDEERFVNGRFRRIVCDPNKVKGTNVPAQLEFFAPDPRWYSATLHTQSITYNASASGRGYNSAASGRAYDYGYGGGGQSNAIILTNAGSFPTLPSARIDGPITNPFITNETTGKTLYLTITLGVGEYLDIDFSAKTLLLNGTASRYEAKSGTWFELVSGDNQIRLGAQSSSGAPVATMSWRDAWL